MRTLLQRSFACILIGVAVLTVFLVVSVLPTSAGVAAQFSGDLPECRAQGTHAVLIPGQVVARTIRSRCLWNHTGIQLDAAVTYEFDAVGIWRDNNRDSGPDGYNSLLLKLGEFKRRVPKARWFALIGTLDEDATTMFVIGNRIKIPAARTGELTAFANDWLSRYTNNSGAITLTIRRL